MKTIATILVLFGSMAAHCQTTKMYVGATYHNAIITVIDSTDKFKWIGTDGGLYRINNRTQKIKFFELASLGYSKNYITDICCLPDGTVWIATRHGLIKFDNYTFILFSTENSELPDNCVLGITITADGSLIVRTSARDVFKMRKTTFNSLVVTAVLKPGSQDSSLLSNARQ